MIPANTIHIAKTFEGFSSKPYLCPAGYWTIGYGHLCKRDHPPISREQGEVYLHEDLMDAYRGTVRLCSGLLLVDVDCLGAIVDFVFNLGAGRLQGSTLRRKINAEEWDEVPTELRKWVYGGGRKLRGLVLRRDAEAVYF